MKSRLLAAAFAALLPAAALAGDGSPDLRFTLGVGVGTQPEYFGSDDYTFGATGAFDLGYIRLGGFEFGRLDGPDTAGFGVTGAFRFVPERDSSDYAELTGLDDIDWTAELGLGARYLGNGYEVFGNIRYGFFGHESFVGTIGADVIAEQGDWTFRAGPRIEIGSGDFNDTYFGVTPAESGASGLAVYDPGSGIYAAGVEIGADYQINRDWSVATKASYQRYVGDANDSPIVQQGSDDFGTFSVVLKRTFTVDW